MITVVLTNDLPSFSPISPPDFVTSGVHRVRNRECSSRALCVGLCVFVLTSFGRKRGDVMKFSLKAWTLTLKFPLRRNQINFMQYNRVNVHIFFCNIKWSITREDKRRFNRCSWIGLRGDVTVRELGHVYLLEQVTVFWRFPWCSRNCSWIRCQELAKPKLEGTSSIIFRSLVVYLHPCDYWPISQYLKKIISWLSDLRV